MIGIPVRYLESKKLKKIVEKVKLPDDPVIILGHWRSGTTHLHNLLCKDPQFGYVTMTQAFFPKSFIYLKIFRNMMKVFMPDTRPQDNVKIGVDEPQEDEFALGSLCPYGFYVSWYFPQQMIENYIKYTCLKKVPSKVKEEWKRVYLELLKKAKYYIRRKSLVIKNPANTVRIKILLELFPNAKFINIHRNPFEIYMSTHKLYDSVLPWLNLQPISKKEIDKNIITIYKDMMLTFLKEKDLIPEENYIELTFKDLEENPIKQLKKIYQKFKLNGFEDIKPLFKDYLKETANYKKNKYVYSISTIEKVKKYWDFALKEWNYDIPDYLEKN